MNDHEPRTTIEEQLARAAHVLEVGQPKVDAVVARARQRQQRHRTAVGVFAVVGICTGSVAAITVLTRPSDPGRIVSAPAPLDSAPLDTAPADTAPVDAEAAPASTELTAPAATVASNLVWNRVDPDSTEALGAAYFANPSMVGDGPFLSWSTAPGRGDDYAPMLWRSDDALRWQPVSTPPPVSGFGLAEHGGRFFALGTAPALSSIDGRKADVAVSSSTDGVEWDTVRVPIDTRALAAEPGVESVGVMTASMAASDSGVLVVVRVVPIIDWQSLLPPGVFVQGWSTTPDGVVIIPRGPCDAAEFGTATTVMVDAAGEPIVTAPTAVCDVATPATAPTQTTLPTETTYTWDELGLSPTVVDAITVGGVRMLRSADGVSYTDVTTPEPSDGAPVTDVQVTAYQDGFAALVTVQPVEGQPSGRLMQSVDGSSWTDLGASPVVYADTIATQDDRIALSGFTGGMEGSTTPIVAVRSADGAWSTTDLSKFVLPSDGVSVTLNGGPMVFGSSGITVAGSIHVDPVAEVGGVEITRDGITMRAEDWSGAYRFLDAATGEELGTGKWQTSDSERVIADRDTGTFQVLDTDGTTVLAEFTDAEMYEQFNELTSIQGSNSKPIPNR